MRINKIHIYINLSQKNPTFLNDEAQKSYINITKKIIFPLIAYVSVWSLN